MDYSMDAVANKVVLVIIGLSVVVSAVGFVIYLLISGSDDASIVVSMLMGVNAATAVPADVVPFAVGVGAAMCLNIAKILLMKRAVRNAVKRDSVSAKFYLQGQYFTRLVLTAAVFVVIGWLHTVTNEAGNPQYANFMGAFFGIFTFPIAMYSMRFFLRNELKDKELPKVSRESSKSVVKNAIDELNAIGAVEEEEAPEAVSGETPNKDAIE